MYTAGEPGLDQQWPRSSRTVPCQAGRRADAAAGGNGTAGTSARPGRSSGRCSPCGTRGCNCPAAAPRPSPPASPGTPGTSAPPGPRLRDRRGVPPPASPRG
uniref:Uncharacterized protein n=1 Tax=Arundo donax TaxID=35708 RepID=A0A0A9END3_ARUDO